MRSDGMMGCMSLGSAHPVASETAEIVCICGSLRFSEEIRAAERELTLAGFIVVAPVVVGKQVTDAQRAAMGAQHLRKIDLANRILIVNPGGYIGESTSREIAYARDAGKPVSFSHPIRTTDAEV